MTDDQADKLLAVLTDLSHNLGIIAHANTMILGALDISDGDTLPKADGAIRTMDDAPLPDLGV